MTATSKGHQAEERDLEMMAQRWAAHRPEAFTEALGVSAAGVKTLTYAIQRDDEAEADKSGEGLTGACWPATSGTGKKRAEQ